MLLIPFRMLGRRSCLIYGVVTSANDLRPALIAGPTLDVSSDFELMRQLLVKNFWGYKQPSGCQESWGCGVLGTVVALEWR